MSFYAILGIPPSASQAEVKAAFRKLAFQFHPDRPTGDTARFQEIERAYATLSDPEKRARYDEGKSELPDMPSEEALIQAELLKHFNLFLQHCDPDFSDPLVMIAEALVAEGKELPKQEAQIQELARKHKALIKRLSRKKGAHDNFILASLQNRVESLELQLPLLKARGIFLMKCRDALKDFLYELPKSRAPKSSDLFLDAFQAAGDDALKYRAFFR